MLRRHAFAGYLHGALLYGSVIACLHLRHNQVASVRDALVVLLWCQLLFGLWSLAAFAAGALLARAWARLRKAPLASDGRWLGLMIFGLLFWLPWFLHGLTYDHVPTGPPAGAWGMLAYVALVAAAIALGVWALTAALVRVPERVARWRESRPLATAWRWRRRWCSRPARPPQRRRSGPRLPRRRRRR